MSLVSALLNTRRDELHHRLLGALMQQARRRQGGDPLRQSSSDVLASTLELMRDMEASTRRKRAIKSEKVRKKKTEATGQEDVEIADASLESPSTDSQGREDAEQSPEKTPEDSEQSLEEVCYHEHHQDGESEQLPEGPADPKDPKLILIRQALDKWVPTEWEVFLARGMGKAEEASERHRESSFLAFCLDCTGREHGSD